MLTYEAYGLRIRSAIPLVNQVASGEPADITIRFGHIASIPPASEALSAGETYRVTSEGVFLFWDAIGTFLVRKGREIIVDPANGIDDPTLRTVVLGPVLAVLLHDRGRLILHASAVAVDGGVAAFAGEPGQGKSALALALYAMGAQLVADDIVSIVFDGATPLVFPSSPQINVWPDTLAALSYDPTVMKKLEPEFEKRAFPATERFSTKRVPLRSVYVLHEGDEVAIEPLPAQEALIQLIRHSYVRVHEGQSASTHLHQCAALINTIAIFRATAPHNLGALRHAAQMIVDDTRKRQVLRSPTQLATDRVLD
jgi:hypothetical protein